MTPELDDEFFSLRRRGDERSEGTTAASEIGMLKKILLTLGLAKAPAPIRTYVVASSFVGAVPALAWVAWKNRDWLRSLVRRVAVPTERRLPAHA